MRIGHLLAWSVRWLCLGSLFIGGIAAVSAAELRYGVRGLPVTLGNPYVADGSTADVILSAIFDGLTRLDQNGAAAPALALSWDNPEPTVWRFKLRRDVAFSNGERFTADAVSAAIDWLKSPAGTQTVAGRHVRNIAEVEVEGPYAVSLHTLRPDATLPARLSAIAIVAPNAWRGLGPDAFARTPAGTGAFMVSDWGGATSQILLDANPASWRAPKVDRLAVINLPDTSARIQALLSGRIHMASGLGVTDIDTVQTGGAFITAAPAMSVAAIALRQDVGRASPLKDQRVRQALNYAVDKDRLNRDVLKGLAAPSGQPAGRWTIGHNPNVHPYPHDPEQAKALLFDAGIVTAFPLRFDVVTGRMPGDAAMLDDVAAQLAQVGINAEIRSIPYGRWLEFYASGAWLSDTDGFLLPFDSMPANDVQSALEPYSCEKAAPFFCDQALAAEIAAANEERNFTNRLALLDKLAQKIHDVAPVLFLTEQFDLFAVSRTVSGFAVAGRVPVYENISLSE